MTILTHDALFLGHHTGRHPESSARLDAVGKMLQDSGLASRCKPGVIAAASQTDIEAVHSRRVWEVASAIADAGGGAIDAETILSEKSFAVALAAAGSLLSNLDGVLNGDDQTALSLVRPPGHHATDKKSMGFCIFNNIAVAAQQALNKHGLTRILIVDWDVHHGNGTQDIFYESDAVHFLSIHRYPFYPGTGSADEIGTGKGLGATYNVPIAYGESRDTYFDKFQRALDKAVSRCKPELVLVSAGFDGHHADPLGDIGLYVEDFAKLTRAVMEAAQISACGRVVSSLEGGYNLQALAACVEAHLSTLLTQTNQEKIV